MQGGGVEILCNYKVRLVQKGLKKNVKIFCCYLYELCIEKNGKSVLMFDDSWQLSKLKPNNDGTV